MRKFLDHHPKNPAMRPESAEQGKKMLDQLRSDIAAKKADRFGVTPINVFVGADGESWCLTEAPSPEAVIKSHEAHGAKLSSRDVVEVTPLA